MPRKQTIQAFEEWVKDEENVAGVLDLIAGSDGKKGLTLQKASLAVKKPFNCLHQYFHSTPERLERYEAARRAWADAKMDEALELADDVAEDKDAVAKAKLQVEVRHNQAKAYHRDRWGDTLRVEKTVTHEVDAGLVGTIGDLLRVAKRPAVTLENVPGRVEAETPPLSALLPAPAVVE